MGKVIRRTVTITINETWTIVWLPGDDPLPHPPTDDQAQANPEGQPDEALQTTIILAEPAPTPRTPAAVEPQPGGAGAVDSSTARRRGKRTRSRPVPSGRKANRSKQ